MSSAKNPIQMENNNNYTGQLDPFHLQSYNGMPPAITYPNANPSVRPPNMYFPPIDFSVPPPNFTQMNVSCIHNSFLQQNSTLTKCSI